jgi:hypothetical protein
MFATHNLFLYLHSSQPITLQEFERSGIQSADFTQGRTRYHEKQQKFPKRNNKRCDGLRCACRYRLKTHTIGACASSLVKDDRGFTRCTTTCEATCAKQSLREERSAYQNYPWQSGQHCVSRRQCSWPPCQSPSAEFKPKVAVAAFRLYGDQSVFESEATRAAKSLLTSFGSSSVTVRANTKSGDDANLKGGRNHVATGC